MNAPERAGGDPVDEATSSSERLERIAEMLLAHEKDVDRLYRFHLHLAAAAGELRTWGSLSSGSRLLDPAAGDEDFLSATHAHLTEGSVRKVSVSMPEGLTEAVRKRVGPGGFSRYVTEAVARQFELDLLADLLAALEAEHGAVPEDLLAEAEAAWPDESEA